MSQMDFRYSSELNFASFQVHSRFKMLNFSHSHRKSKRKYILFMLSGYCNSGKRAQTQNIYFSFPFFFPSDKINSKRKERNYGRNEHRIYWGLRFGLLWRLDIPKNWDIRTKYTKYILFYLLLDESASFSYR